MNLKICLAKKVLIFYSVIAPFIMYGSLHNVIHGLILKDAPSYRIGPFSIFGFLIMPFLLVITYLRNSCVITPDSLTIFKTVYKFSDYDIYIGQKELPLKERPLTSLFKKTYNELLIKQRSTNETVEVKDLDVFEKDIVNVKNAISANKRS